MEGEGGRVYHLAGGGGGREGVPPSWWRGRVYHLAGGGGGREGVPPSWWRGREGGCTT